ncbi:hypothetical protein ABT288_31145 [Streptomyces sp. NPDC001093]|uniref:hypothetical protein n=1 Tax=Streptomyces sp. NPDC001093 TaxID=3154376 RepID=UPI003331F349
MKHVDDTEHMDHFERQLTRLMHSTQEPVRYEPRHQEALHAGVRVRRRVRAARRAAGSVLAVAGLGLGLLLWPHGHTDGRPSAPHPRPATSPTPVPSTSPGPSQSPSTTYAPSGPPSSTATDSATPGSTTSTANPPGATGSSATATPTQRPPATATSGSTTAPPASATVSAPAESSDNPSSAISPTR